MLGRVVLLPADYVAKMDSILSGMDAFFTDATVQFAEKMQQYMDSEDTESDIKARESKAFTAFMQNEPRLAGYLYRTTHDRDGLGQIAEVFLEIVNTPGFSDRLSPYDYVKGYAEAEYERYKKLFDEFPEFSTKNGKLTPACQQALDTLQQFHEFAVEQNAFFEKQQATGKGADFGGPGS